ncbi:MAG: thioredoxin-dependent thiol peroxidase [Deltaproteobacteria bacterium]|nr:thioredoxin-dependent thiol peroxidase [Deltaproteobacteria bacterium]MBW2255960.1 thioredoxin-dependent thiol peroxidase [Deltaproteobacteria bacterium]
MLEPGATAPEFTLRDQDGREVRWSDFQGQPVAVFFYPKANTPGCTKEACAFRDDRQAFEERGVQVVGLSADSVKSQANFHSRYELTMPLLSDPERTVLEPWGVWGEKKNYGRTYMGIRRSTFLFDADGKLLHVWPNVRVKGHVTQVLDKIDELLG